MLEDDRELLDAFRRGERGALARVYEATFAEVEIVVRRGFVTGMNAEHRVPGLGADDEARDVIQECYVRAFSQASRAAYDGLRPFRPYLLRIVKNLMIDRARKSNRQPVLADDAGVGDIDGAVDRNEPLHLDAALPQDEALHWKRLRAAYAEFATTLDDEQRELVRLRFDEGLSQRDAAAELGASRRRVRTVEERVRNSLEAFLRERDLMP